MKRIKNFLAIGAFSLLILGIPALASAQSRDRDRDDDRYGNNGNYGNNGGYNNGNNNGRYGNNNQYGDMRSTVRNLKTNAREFQRQLDRDLDRSRYNGSRREDQMNQLANRFKSAVNDLDNNGYSNNNNGRYGNNNNNDQRELRQVFEIASQIERSIGRSGVSYASQNLWSAIRNDLQVLGRNYSNGNGRGNGRNNGGYGNGQSTGNWNRPSWWPF